MRAEGDNLQCMRLWLLLEFYWNTIDTVLHLLNSH